MGILKNLFGGDKNKKLIVACAVGNNEEAIDLLRQGANINSIGEEGQTALITAIMSDNYDIAKMLIDNGADIQASFLDGVTPLMCASKIGRLSIIMQLINKGANVNSIRSDGETALLIAVVENNYDAAKILIENGAEVNHKNIDNETALAFAVLKGFEKMVQLLIESGADINTYGDYELTPLMRAANEGHLEIATLLLEKGANINDIGLEGRTALLVALSSQNYDIAQLLIEKGTDVTIIDNEGIDALDFARSDDNQELERLIIEKRGKQIAHKEVMSEMQLDLNVVTTKFEKDIKYGELDKSEAFIGDNCKKHSEINWGNTTGNIANNGYAVQYGKSIFFINANDGFKIYKYCIESNESIIICHDKAMYLNYYGGWLHYLNISDNCRIYKILSDGSSRTKVNQDISDFINISDGWIYYINRMGEDGDGDEINNIYKVRVDGSERTQIGDISTAVEIYINGDWIYYKTLDFDEIYRISTNGDMESLIIVGFASSLNIIDGWIYYIDDMESRIYKAYDDGSNPTMIDYYDLPDADYDLPCSINVVDDWIYYSTNNIYTHYKSDGVAIRKIRTDGSEKTHILNINNNVLPHRMEEYLETGAVDLNIAGDWFYFTVRGDNELKAFKAKVDGSEFNVLK